MDFSQKYRGVVHFGLWAEERADDLGARDALSILHNAAKRAYSEDMRGEGVSQALDYLSRYAVRQRPFDDYRKALDIPDPVKRVSCLYDSLHRIAKEAG